MNFIITEVGYEGSPYLVEISHYLAYFTTHPCDFISRWHENLMCG